MKLVAPRTAVSWLLALGLVLTKAQDLPDGFVACNEDGLVSNTLQPFISSSHNPFCMNGGMCKENYQETPESPCDCPEGVAGPHCEFENGKVPDCDLECFNGGVCQAGVRTWTGQHFSISPSQWNYCECKEGFYGSQCEMDGRQCGPKTHCLNGGGCVTIDRADGTETYHCDCTQSKDERGTQYAGRYCQIKAESTCSDHDPVSPTNYCVNGGTCRPEAWLGCECPSGFMGHMCEFNEIDDEPYECNMQCDNGFCRKGAKDTSWLTEFNFGSRRLTQRFTEDFEHCQCPPGWVGLHCDAKMNVCPGRTNVCLNGGGCVLSDSDPTNPFNYVCDCSVADEKDRRYAGKYCQYHATSYCTVDGLKSRSDAFCTNNGVCLGFVAHGDAHPGCLCDDAFEGEHCEILADPDAAVDEDDEINDGGDSNNLGDLIWIFIVVLSFVSILMIVFAATMHRRTRMHRKFIIDAAHSQMKHMDPYHDNDTEIIDFNENIAAGESVFNSERELALDPVFDTAPYTDTPRVTSPGGEKSVDGEASRVSKISTSDKTKKTKGGKSRKKSRKASGRHKPSSPSRSSPPGPLPFGSDDADGSPNSDGSRYEEFLDRKSLTREFDHAALMDLGGESRTISSGNNSNGDYDFNLSDYAEADYSFEDSSMGKIQLTPITSSKKGGRREIPGAIDKGNQQGSPTVKTPENKMVIKRISTDQSAHSGMSSDIASMSSMGSASQGFGRTLQATDSYDSLAKGPTLYLSDEYSLGQGNGRIYETNSGSQDIPATIDSDSLIDRSSLVVLSEASALAGTVLSTDNSAMSSNSASNRNEAQVLSSSATNPSNSVEESNQSVASVASSGIRSVRFEETSRNLESFSSALTEVAAGGRTLGSESSASSASGFFIFGDETVDQTDSRNIPYKDIQGETSMHSSNSHAAVIGASAELTDPQDASVSTARSHRSQNSKSREAVNVTDSGNGSATEDGNVSGLEGSALSVPATIVAVQQREESGLHSGRSASINSTTQHDSPWVVRVEPLASRVERMQAGWHNDDSSTDRHQDEQSSGVRSSTVSVQSRKSVQSRQSVHSERSTNSAPAQVRSKQNRDDESPPAKSLPEKSSSEKSMSEQSTSKKSSPPKKQTSEKSPSKKLEKTPSKKRLSEKTSSEKPVLEKTPSKKRMSEKSPSKKRMSEKSSSDKPLLEKTPSKKGMSAKSSSDKPLLEKTPSKKRMSEKSPSKKRLSEKSSSEKPLLEKTPSKKREKTPSKKRDLEKSPSKKRDLEKNPSKKRDLEKSPSKKRDLEKIPSKRDLSKRSSSEKNLSGSVKSASTTKVAKTESIRSQEETNNNDTKNSTNPFDNEDNTIVDVDEEEKKTEEAEAGVNNPSSNPFD